MKEKKEKKNRLGMVIFAARYVWKVTGNLHKCFLVMILLSAFNQLLATGFAYLIGKVPDVLTGHSLLTQNQVVIMVLLFSLLRHFVIQYEHHHHIKYVAYDLDSNINMYLLNKLFKFSPGQTTRENTGFRMDTITKGVNGIVEFANIVQNNIIPILFKLFVSVILIYWINYTVGLIITLTAIIFIVVSFSINNYFQRDIIRTKKLEGEMETKLWEIVRNMRLVITMATQEKTLRKFGEIRDHNSKEGKSVWLKYNMVCGCARNLLFEHFVYAPVFYFVFYLFRKGEITVGDVMVILTSIFSVYSSMASVGHLQRQIMGRSANIKSFVDLIECQPECADVEDAIELINPRGNISFDHVTFKYEDNRPHALVDVSFRIKSGETVAFVGKTGSGKSTIVSLLLRSHRPNSGEICVEDIPLDQVEINSWRKHVGVVSQETMLWDGTVEENITFGVVDRVIDDETMDRILSDSRVDEFLDRLGEGGIKKTEIGENGIQLSGGQRQRIALGRVFARDPRVVIFDEATSALDNKTEAEVYEAMNRALIGRTGIIIAHRLNTVKNANRIIVLDKGCIVGEGSFEYLSANNAYFQELIGSEIR